MSGLLGSGRTEVAELVFGAIKARFRQARRRRAPRWKSVSPGHSLHLGLAFCPEDRKAEGLFSELTVRENIVLGLQTKRGWLRRLSR